MVSLPLRILHLATNLGDTPSIGADEGEPGSGRRPASHRPRSVAPREGGLDKGGVGEGLPATRGCVVTPGPTSGFTSRGGGYSGLWQTASTLFPSGSRTKAP